MDDIIKNLNDIRTKHENEINKIRDKIRILDSIPKAKALLGKCFKYRNGFTFGGNRRGWVYKHIAGVAGENLIVDTFEYLAEGPNKFEFSFHEIEYVSRFNHPAFIQISKKKYKTMFNKLVKHIASQGKRRINGL